MDVNGSRKSLHTGANAKDGALPAPSIEKLNKPQLNTTQLDSVKKSAAGKKVAPPPPVTNSQPNLTETAASNQTAPPPPSIPQVPQDLKASTGSLNRLSKKPGAFGSFELPNSSPSPPPSLPRPPSMKSNLNQAATNGSNANLSTPPVPVRSSSKSNLPQVESSAVAPSPPPNNEVGKVQEIKTGTTQAKLSTPQEYQAITPDSTSGMIPETAASASEHLSNSPNNRATEISRYDAVPQSNTSTMFTNTTYVALEEPKKEDKQNDPPTFSPQKTQQHSGELLKVLKLPPDQLSGRQRDMQKKYFEDFFNHYQNVQNFSSNATIHQKPELIGGCFVALREERHPALTKILNLLMILSRGLQSNPKAREEERLSMLLNFLRLYGNNKEIAQSVGRALLNFAEKNSAIISANNGLDVISMVFSSHANDSPTVSIFLWLIRNLTVNEGCRKAILDKMGFLIVNAINSFNEDVSVAEHGCWALGNLALTKETGSFFTAMGALSAAKSAMAAHPDQQRVQEAGSWLYYNASFDDNVLKLLPRLGLDEVFNGALKRYPDCEKLHDWLEGVYKRVKIYLQSTNPNSEKSTMKPIREGYLVCLGQSVFKKFGKKWFFLQYHRLAATGSPKDPELLFEIKLKDVTDISIDGQTSVKISTKQKQYILESTDGASIEAWLADLKSAWKHSVSYVTENPLSPNHDKFPAGYLSNSASEAIQQDELMKFCLAHAYHEIYNNPYLITRNFGPDKQYQGVAFKDWVATVLTKEYVQEYLAQSQSTLKIPNREYYDGDKMRKELSHMIDSSLMTRVQRMEKEPMLDKVPKVFTRYDFCAKQGIRPTMEDRHIHLPYVDYLLDRKNTNEPVSFYAVYDGHGGTHVAQYVEDVLHYNVMKHDSFEENTRRTLAAVYLRTQEDFKEYTERLCLPNTAGATSVTILFKGKKMYVAWAGDSLACMFKKDGSNVELVDPHKPTKESEKIRIEKLGGFINDENGVMRVNGVVAVSRAFGNLRHRVIIPEADVREFTLTGDEEYIVLACDGLWDVMTPSQVRRFVRKTLKKNKNSTKGMAEALVDESLRLGSTDNVSVIFIQFDWWQNPKK